MKTGVDCVYHDLSDLLWVVSIKVKPESHHLPVVGLQLTLCYPVPSVGDLHTHTNTKRKRKRQSERRKLSVNR